MSILRCRHRHTIDEHPSCFNPDGTLRRLPRAPKVLLFDLETSPLVVFSWGVYDQHIHPDDIINDWYLLSWSAKWLFDSKIMSDCVTSAEAKTRNDLRIVKSMWKLLDEADIIIAHNAKKFDVKKINARFIFHKLPPPSNYKVIDTLSVLRSVAGFSSNALGYINKLLNLSLKGKTDSGLWKDCYYGDKDALRKMVDYNINDTAILEELYVILRPWMKNHPNLALYQDSNSHICPNCGSDKIILQGSYYTPTGEYTAFRCQSCGNVGRCSDNLLTKDKRKLLLKG